MSLGSWKVIGTAGAVCIHTLLMPNNRILCIERPKPSPYAPNPFTKGEIAVEINLYDSVEPFKNDFKLSYQVKAYSKNPFCSGTAQMENGTWLLIGGDQQTGPGVVSGTFGRRIYKPCAAIANFNACRNGGQWTPLPDMNNSRWYPTTVTSKFL